MDEPNGLTAPIQLSPGPAEPRPASARRALLFALDTPGRDLWLASVFLLIPVVGWAALSGWLAEMQRRMARGSPEPLPRLSLRDLGVHARSGLGAWAIVQSTTLAFAAIALAIGLLVNASALVALALGGELVVALAMLAVAALATVTLTSLWLTWMGAALTRAELGEPAMTAVFSASEEARGRRLHALARYASLSLLGLGVLGAGAMVCGIGLLPALVLVQIAAARLRGELHGERIRRGLPAAEASAPRLLPSERKAVPRLPGAVLGVLVLLSGCTKSSASQNSAPPAPSATALAAAPPSAGASASAAPTPPPRAGPPVVIRAGGKRAVRGEHGVVTSVEANATRAGVRMLERGGNAVDAAVAVGYALAVTHPSAGNVGGGGFMLVRPRGGPTIAIDFRETAPAALTQEKFDRMIDQGATGPLAVGIPGTPAGLNLAHARFGKLPLREVLAPAIELAKKGHRLGTRQGQTIGWAWSELSKDPASRAIFGDGKRPKKPGSWLQQPDLARVLERIAEKGSDGFYRGPTAEALVRALAPAGVTAKDFSGYEAKLREPLVVRYRGLDVEIMPPPSAGGVAVANTLGILERVGASAHPAGSAEELHLFIEASKRAQAEKRFAVLDPDALAPAALAERRKSWLDVDALLARTPAIDPKRATPASEVHPLFAAAMRELEHTTHFSVTDADGGVVSCTTTLSAGFGARMVAPATGIVLNNSVAAFGTAGENLPAPGRRTTSSMAPALVLSAGKVVLVLGSPGGDTIPSTVTQVLRNVVDHGMTIDLAVDAPRIHHGFAPDEVRYERKRPPPRAVLDQLGKLGHAFSKKRIPIGDANDILISDGVAFGYADPREGGLALAARAAE